MPRSNPGATKKTLGPTKLAAFRDFVLGHSNPATWPPSDQPLTSPGIVIALARAAKDAIKVAICHEQLRTLGFEIIGNGPDGLKHRIGTELPMYLDVIGRASNDPV